MTVRFNPLLIGVIAVVLPIVLLSIVAGPATAAATAVNVSAGAFHTVVLMSDGTVWTWGAADTDFGVLGTGANPGDGSMRQVQGLPTIVAVEANFKTSFAIDSDGRVWAWGSNEKGQCGTDEFASYSSPVMISGLKDIVQISCGGLHCAAVDKNGNVWAWGDNLYGQLGSGYSGAAQHTPVKISVDNVKMAVAGRGYTAVLKNDGTVWAWGENDLGMTGDSSKANTLWPSQVQGLSDIVKIDAGMDHTLALRSDGTVWAWGDGKENILCNGQGYTSTVFVNVPVQVGNLPKVTDIQAADFCSLALGSDGNVYVWGSNGDGQYGNSVDLWTPATTPQKVPGLGDVASITAGLGHCVAVKKDGSVWAWGRNQEDQVQPGKGKKVLSPLKKIDGGATMPTQSANPTPGGQQQQTPGESASNADMTLYIAAGGVILLVLAVIGAIFLIRIRKD